MSDTFRQYNQENVTIIWFESGINTSEEMKQAKEAIQTINYSVLFHNDIKTFNDYLESINKRNIFLVVSGNDVLELLRTIHKLSWLDSVFVFSDDREKYIDLVNRFPRNIKICGHYDELILSIKETIIDVNNQMKMFSFYDRNQAYTQDLSEQSAKFLWFQLFKDVIYHLPRDDKGKEDMISACQQYYRENQSTLKQIEQFNQNYQKNQCIEWYTKDIFLYRMINRALRTEDIDQLYLFRYYIADLSNQLAQEYDKFRHLSETRIHLYRGMIIPKKEIKRLKANEGQLIAVNGYWSTSRSELCALKYVDGHTNDGDTIAVLFQIECDLQAQNDFVIFADIKHLSCSCDEEEVLFDIGATFRIQQIDEEKRENTDILVVQLKISDEGREIIEEYKQENRDKMKEESPTIMLCTLLKRMGKVEKSLQFLQKLYQNPGNENLAHIHHRIGIALKVTNEYESALEHFEKAYTLTVSSDPPQLIYAALVLYNEGRLYDKMKKFDEALRVSEEAVKILKKETTLENCGIAKLYSSIGRIYYHQKNFQKALQYQYKALEIRQNCLSSDHVVITFSYADIGNIYLQQDDYEHALENFCQALTIREKSLPSDHHYIAWSLHRIGKVYQKKKDYKLALEYHLKSLDISDRYISPSLNYLVLATLTDIVSIYDHKSDWQRKLMYLLKILKIRKVTRPLNYSILLQDLETIIALYDSMRNTEDLLTCYEELIQIRRKIESRNYSTLADDLDKIAHKYKSAGKWNDSLKNYTEVVEIRKKYLPDDYSSLAGSLYGLASVYEIMGENTKALEYYNEQLNIYTNTPSHSRYSDTRRSIEDNIARIKQSIK